MVMGFNVYWAALPSGGRDSLLAVAEAQNHDYGSGGCTVTGVHWNVTGTQSKTANGGVEKRVGTKV